MLKENTFPSPQKTYKTQKSLCFIVAVLLFIPSICNFLSSFVQLGLKIESLPITPMFYIFMALCSAFVLLKYWNKSKKLFIVCIFIIFSALLSYLIYPDIRKNIFTTIVDLVYNPINKLIIFCLPALYASYFLTDYKMLFNTLLKWAYPTALIGALMYFYVALFVGEELQYMVYSYFMLTPVCFCFEAFFMGKNRTFSLLLAVMGSISILFCGARGAVISLLLYLLIRVVSVSIRKKRYILFLFCVSAIFFIFLFLNEIIQYIYNLCLRLGVDSRFITSIINGELSQSVGRDEITTAIIQGIWDNPLGYGVWGDRYITSVYWTQPTYSHNIVLELWCDFGIFAGSAILFVLIKKLFSAMRSTNSCYNCTLWAIIPYGILQLLFSSSLFANVMFFSICGMIFSKKEFR